MTDASDPARGSSANWDRVDQVMFSWLDRPAEDVDRELANLRVEDPTLAHAVESRLARVRWLGQVVHDPTPAAGPRAGATFGDYRIVRPLGQGGMGSVYLAEQPSLGRHVALKVIRGDRLRDHGARERFRREARAVADLRHPGICGVIDVGEVDDTPFLAMQYIDGETLAERLTVQRAEHAPGHDTGAPTTAAQIGSVLQLIETVARALHAAHEAGVVHRDVKPANVMLDRDGQPVLLDFGLAQVAAADGEPTLTLSGDLLGTPAYMSPEQVRPQGQTIDRRTDVYSLAVTLFECLTLQRPFAGSTQADLYERIVRDPTPDPRRCNPNLPTDVGAVLGKAMEKEPSRRYATAAEFADELARLRRHEPVRARRVGVLGRASRWARRNPRAAVLMLGLGAALVASSLLLRLALIEREQAVVAKAASDHRTEDIEGLLNATMSKAQSLLVRLPGSRPTRQFLVEQAGMVLERLEAEPHPSFRTRALLADQCKQLADAFGYPSWPNLGQEQQALALYHRALDKYTLLLGEAGAEASAEDRRVLVRNASICHEHLADLLESMGKLEPALQALQASMQLVDRFLAEDPTAASGPHDRGNVQTAIARLQYRLGRAGEAAASFAAARQAFEQGLAVTPGDRLLVEGLAASLEAHGLLADSTGDAKGAEDLFLQSLARRQQLLQTDPADAEAMKGAASSACNAADCSLARGDLRAAKALLEPAAQLSRKLVAADTGDVHALALHSRTVMHLAKVLAGQQRTDEALALHREFMQSVEAVPAAQRTLPMRRDWSYHAELAAAILAEHKALDEALRLDQRVLAERRAFVQADDSAHSRDELMVAFRNLRSDHIAQSHDSELLQLDEERLELATTYATAFPDDRRLQMQHVDALLDLGFTKEHLHDLTGARVAWQASLAKIEQMITAGDDGAELRSRRNGVSKALAKLERMATDTR